MRPKTQPRSQCRQCRAHQLYIKKILTNVEQYVSKSNPVKHDRNCFNDECKKRSDCVMRLYVNSNYIEPNKI